MQLSRVTVTRSLSLVVSLAALGLIHMNGGLSSSSATSSLTSASFSPQGPMCFMHEKNVSLAMDLGYTPVPGYVPRPKPLALQAIPTSLQEHPLLPTPAHASQLLLAPPPVMLMIGPPPPVPATICPLWVILGAIWTFLMYFYVVASVVTAYHLSYRLSHAPARIEVEAVFMNETTSPTVNEAVEAVPNMEEINEESIDVSRSSSTASSLSIESADTPKKAKAFSFKLPKISLLPRRPSHNKAASPTDKAEAQAPIVNKKRGITFLSIRTNIKELFASKSKEKGKARRASTASTLGESVMAA